jgi:hypothetical protein
MTDGKRRLRDWLAAFMDYTAQLESPACYLRWAGLSTVAGAAQRKIYAESTAYLAYPNLYITLVGPPGAKKSTAIRMGKRLLRQVPGINFTSDAPSVAGIMLEFKDIASKEHQSLNAFIGELSTIYENAADTMTGFLTAIYDGDDEYIKRTRIGGVEAISKPWFNLIAGTTPTWLGDNLSRSAVEGGLVARTLYVYSDEIILQSPFPEYSEALRVLEKDLVHDLAHISNLYGCFTFEGGKGGAAYKWYSEWYLDRTRLPRVADNRTAGYFVRKPQHLLKVAMLVSLCYKDELLFTVADFEVGLALLESLEPGMIRAFSAVGGNTYASDLERIIGQVRGCGTLGMTYGELIASNYHQLQQRDIDASLQSACSMGRIKLMHTDKGKVYIGTEFIR